MGFGIDRVPLFRAVPLGRVPMKTTSEGIDTSDRVTVADPPLAKADRVARPILDIADPDRSCRSRRHKRTARWVDRMSAGWRTRGSNRRWRNSCYRGPDSSAMASTHWSSSSSAAYRTGRGTPSSRVMVTVELAYGP